MSNKKIYTYVNTEVEIDVVDILDQLDDEDLLDEVKSRGLKLDQFVSNGIPSSTVYDDLKINVLKEAYSKYTLEELEEKLK